MGMKRSLSYHDPISVKLAECSDEIEAVRQMLLDDAFLLKTFKATDVIERINHEKRDACVARLSEILVMTDQLLCDLKSVVEYEDAWTFGFEQQDGPLGLI